MNEILRAVEKYSDLMVAAEQYIRQNPETGYREVKTTAYLAKHFEKLGYTLTYPEDITGFYTVVDTGREGPEVLIFGELDAVLCPTHPDADPVTGAVHACGHHAQCAALLGIAAALTEPAVLDRLSGRIRLCAVPAEELLEIEYRTELKKQGQIKYYGGKPEFLRRGYLDGVDLAFMVHASSEYYVSLGSNGLIAKTVTYRGVAAHAALPQSGCNALYAATCGINAVNAIRETFQEKDQIRVHPIVTHGGDIVNGIPARVVLESYVRGSNYPAIVAENRKVNRALCGAALSLGANVDITDMPGYAPLINDAGMIDVAREALAKLSPQAPLSIRNSMNSGSTDMGDISCVMPVVHPYVGGACGIAHGADYAIPDPRALCVSSAAWQVTMLDALLGNGAERARQIVKNFKPRFATKEEFFAFQDSLERCGNRIVYREDGDAEVDLK